MWLQRVDAASQPPADSRSECRWGDSERRGLGQRQSPRRGDDVAFVISSVPSSGSCPKHISVRTRQKTGNGCDNMHPQSQAVFPPQCGHQSVPLLIYLAEVVCVICWKWPQKQTRTVASFFLSLLMTSCNRISYNSNILHYNEAPYVNTTT